MAYSFLLISYWEDFPKKAWEHALGWELGCLSQGYDAIIGTNMMTFINSFILKQYQKGQRSPISTLKLKYNITKQLKKWLHV